MTDEGNEKAVTSEMSISPERIECAILILRGHKVLLDEDLARLYGVETKAFNRALKRNLDRFPEDFMFQLNAAEFENLRCQIGTSRSWGGRRYSPYAFTEQGVAMLSSILKSKRAIRVNIEIMRTFVRLRRLLASHEELAGKLADLEKKYDSQFKMVFDAIRKLMAPDQPKRRPIGFRIDDDQKKISSSDAEYQNHHGKRGRNRSRVS